MYNLYINDMNSLYFNECFDGSTKIIDYSCQVNDETYTTSFGMTLSQISVSAISSTLSDYTF